MYLMNTTVALPDDEVITAASAPQLPEANLQVLAPCVRNRREAAAVAAWPGAGQHSQHEGNGPDGSADSYAGGHPGHHRKA